MNYMEFGERWDCPACGESNTRTNQKCYACGAPRPGSGVQEPAAAAPRLAANQWLCPRCNQPVSRGAKCPGCGAQEPAAQPAGPQATAVPVAGGVKIVDFDIPFGSLVVFLIKFAFAAIPAAIVVAILWGVGALVIAALLAGAH
jgi:hypothetical protein